MLKKYLCGLALLLWLSCLPCFSEAYLTDEQEEELWNLLTESQTELANLKTESRVLKNQLEISQEQCSTLEAELEQLQNQLTESEQDVRDLRTSSEEQKKSYEKRIKNEGLKATVFEILSIVLAIACAVIAVF